MLLDWHEQLLAISDVGVYHVSVIQSPPRFVQGLIGRAIGKFYTEVVSDDRALILFIDDIESFASQAGFTIDDDPTLVLVDSSGDVLGFVKGENTQRNINKLQELLSSLST
jgi:predicted metallo-beta-lactamase superfamily hydrolase